MRINVYSCNMPEFAGDLLCGPKVAITVEVRNRFKGQDLIDRVPDELWTEVHDIVQETGSMTIPQEKEMQKSKMAV